MLKERESPPKKFAITFQTIPNMRSFYKSLTNNSKMAYYMPILFENNFVRGFSYSELCLKKHESPQKKLTITSKRYLTCVPFKVE